jgi:hypothetical protein
MNITVFIFQWFTLYAVLHACVKQKCKFLPLIPENVSGTEWLSKEYRALLCCCTVWVQGKLLSPISAWEGGEGGGWGSKEDDRKKTLDLFHIYSLYGAATKRCILQQLHHKTELALTRFSFIGKPLLFRKWQKTLDFLYWNSIQLSNCCRRSIFASIKILNTLCLSWKTEIQFSFLLVGEIWFGGSCWLSADGEEQQQAAWHRRRFQTKGHFLNKNNF